MNLNSKGYRETGHADEYSHNGATDVNSQSGDDDSNEGLCAHARTQTHTTRHHGRRRALAGGRGRVPTTSLLGVESGGRAPRMGVAGADPRLSDPHAFSYDVSVGQKIKAVRITFHHYHVC